MSEQKIPQAMDGFSSRVTEVSQREEKVADASVVEVTGQQESSPVESGTTNVTSSPVGTDGAQDEPGGEVIPSPPDRERARGILRIDTTPRRARPEPIKLITCQYIVTDDNEFCSEVFLAASDFAEHLATVHGSTPDEVRRMSAIGHPRKWPEKSMDDPDVARRSALLPQVDMPKPEDFEGSPRIRDCGSTKHDLCLCDCFKDPPSPDVSGED